MPVIASLTLAVILRLNAILPQAPGNIGTFQAATVIGLRLFRNSAAPPIPARPTLRRRRFGPFAEMAQDFSIILWGILTLPLLVFGFVAVALTGTNLGEIHRHARTSMKDRHAVPENTLP